jgi:hypothetical protein
MVTEVVQTSGFLAGEAIGNTEESVEAVPLRWQISAGCLSIG